MKHYRTSIPKEARERVIATYLTGPTKYIVECVLKGEVVGVRYFHESGELLDEYSYKDGLKHGVQYRADDPGRLLSAEPYYKGLPHGTAKQWSDDGTLIGTYTMKRGTGIDLWWQQFGSEEPSLSEVHYMRNGKLHGFVWWISEGKVWDERHYQHGRLHGVERSWNNRDRLCRGYPRYWVGGERISKQQYLRACKTDPTLPPFRIVDNAPKRKFPPEIARNLARK